MTIRTRQLRSQPSVKTVEMTTTKVKNEIPLDPTSTRLGDNYLLEQEIGRSQAASLFRAVELKSGSWRAVKVFRRRFSADPRFVVRFREQMKEILTIQNEHLVSVVDYGVIDGRFYIATEWVEGLDLGAFLSEHGPLSAAQAISTTSQVCAALETLHSRGLVHRNLKTQNILLTRNGQVKITDAGLSGLLSESGLSRTHVMVGRFHYIAPEQVRGQAAGPESDLYSLGILLYQMLTNQPPFDARDAWQVLHMHIEADPLTEESFTPQIPPALRAIILRAMQKDPAQRFVAAAEMNAALKDLLPRNASGEPIISIYSAPKQLTDSNLAATIIRVQRFLLAPAPFWILGRQIPFWVFLAAQLLISFILAFLLFYLLSGLNWSSALQPVIGFP
jgi:eukaryotic-like serine/threonine-protein kinase